MSDQPPFSPLRAAFWLLAAVVLTELFTTLIAASGCMWMVLTRAWETGACQNVSTQIKEVWSEVLAAVLALLLAGKSDNRD